MQQQEKPSEVPRPPGSDLEDGSKARPESHFRGLSDVQKSKKEDWMKKGVFVLVLRSLALVFSFLSFILIVIIPQFHLYSTSTYVFAVALITMAYTLIQVGIKGDELRTGRDVIPSGIAVWIDFIGDQVMAYMLLSSASAGGAIINLMRIFTMGYTFDNLEKATAAVAMSFLAFFSLAPAALISGYRLCIELSRS